MLIIFEDCLGFVRDGKAPFAGLATRPASAAAKAQLPGRMPNRAQAVELLSPRYVASWGEDADAMAADEVSPLAISSWSEPATGHEQGPLRPVSLSIIGTTPADAQGIAEAGLIVMGGPPGGRRATPAAGSR